MKEGVENETRLAHAKEILEIRTRLGSYRAPEVVEKVKEYGFHTNFEASGLVGRANAPETGSFPIHAMTIGNVGFIFAPYEMFASHGVMIKEGSVCPTTFISTCSGGSNGYIPDDRGVEIECYEACITSFEYGTGEKLAQLFIDTLAQLQGK